MQETELKLSLPNADTAVLEQALDRMTPRVDSMTLHNCYFDTPDHVLHRERIALRIRQVPKPGKVHWIQTLKMGGSSDSALSQRGEWEAELPNHQLSLDALQATPWVQWDASGAIFARLEPCFKTVFERTTWRYENTSASMEVALDVGEVLAGQAHTPIAELECELRAGAPADLFDLAEQLASQVALLPATMSKAQRGFALARNSMHSARKRKDFCTYSSHERAHKVLHDAFGQFIGNLNTLVLNRSEEVLRQCLIGFRRFRAAQSILQRLSLYKFASMPIWHCTVRLLNSLLRNNNQPTNLQAAFALIHQTLLRPEASLELLQTSRWLALELVPLNKQVQ